MELEGSGKGDSCRSWGQKYRDNWDNYIMQKTIKQSIKELESLRRNEFLYSRFRCANYRSIK